MGSYLLSDIELKLIEKYQLTKDEDIALYFFNKIGEDVLNIIYSKVNLHFSSIPLEREDLTSFVWKSLKKGLEECKLEKDSLWAVWIKNSYFTCIKEIKKFFKNSELVLNFADSWDVFQQTHSVYKKAKSAIQFPKKSIKDAIDPIVDYVSTHTKTYTKTNIRKLLYLKSLGYSEREIASKMNVSRRYISSMIKLVLKISKNYLRTSNR